jgi:hypothetical protein
MVLPRIRKIGIVFLFVTGFLLSTTMQVGITNHIYPENNEANQTENIITPREASPELIDRMFSYASNGDETGTLNPLPIEQIGYSMSENTTSRTDTGDNAANITVDEANDWYLSGIDLELWNLRREYVENGTFDDGADAWVGHTFDPSSGSQTQTTFYNPSGESYIGVRNTGMKNHPNQPLYKHYGGSHVLWNQTIDNSPYTQNFTLYLDFLYDTGPLDPHGDDALYEQAYLAIIIDDNYYVLDLVVDISSRDVWYSIDGFDIDIDSVSSSFFFSIGLWIDPYWGDLDLDGQLDYDDNGSPDGAEHTQNITVLLDDVYLIGETPPDVDEVDLQFHAGSFSTQVIGTGGSGTANITNPSYWTTDPVAIEITSNTSVSFDYRTRSKAHRISNSTWIADPEKPGVSYTVAAGQTVSLSTFMYVQMFGQYEDMIYIIRFPNDWENATIYNPFLSNVTGQCQVTSENITVPTALLDKLGWWEITYESLNYADALVTQIQNSGSGIWSNETRFRSSNKTRVQANIGTLSITPVLDDPVNFTWYLPNGSVWSQDSVLDGSSGEVNSSSRILGPLNTSAGQWLVTVSWNNGTEVAFDSVSFDMIHCASLTPLNTLIESDSDLTVTNFLNFVDTDNGEYLMNGEATVVGNWSGLDIFFTPILVRNWWEADFDLTTVGEGQFVVKVNASRQYYDNATCQFTIISTHRTSFDITSEGGIPSEIGLNENYTVEMRYELEDATDISGAQITASFSGPTDGLSFYPSTESSPGNYSIKIHNTISGTYTITLTASRPYHYNASDSFTLIVGELNSQLIRENGTADFVRIGDDYNLVLSYENSTGHGLPGANVEIVDVTPGGGLSYGSTSDLGNGLYAILLTPNLAETFTVIVRANITNHVTQYTSFTLTVSEIPTVLNIGSAGAEISADQLYTVQLTFLDDLSNGLEGATITVLNPPSGVMILPAFDLLGGHYNVTLDPSMVGTYQIAFRASLTNYQNSTVGFTLIVTQIQTDLYVVGGRTTDSMLFSQKYDLEIAYVRTDTGQNVSSAGIYVSTSPHENIDWMITTVNGYYVVTLSTSEVGIWKVFITANKTDYIDGWTEFELEVTTIATSVNSFTFSQALVYGRLYNLTFVYQMSNQSGITGASVSASGSAAAWIASQEMQNGQYSILLTTLGLGSYDAIIEFSRPGFETETSLLSFQVGPVTVQVIDIQGLNAPEGELTTFSLRVVDTETSEPISGATVQYQLTEGTSSSELMTLSETGVGVYSGTLTMPRADRVTRLRLFVTLGNHTMEEDYHEVVLTPTVNEFQALIRTVENFSPFLFLLGIATVAYGGRRVYNRRQREKNIEAMIVKRRFDDAQSILGVIVLHKRTGLPIYSKIVKGGIDEALVSGFISAITTFRSEFEVSQKDFEVTPISDIIRAVPTQNLLCAFITLGAPSKAQELRMIEFAETVGFIFDQTYTEAPAQTIEYGTQIQFDSLFDDILDGRFLKKHKIEEPKKLPSRPRCVGERIMKVDEMGCFELSELASEMASCGLEEARVYKLIYDALENQHIIALTLEEDSPTIDAETIMEEE